MPGSPLRFLAGEDVGMLAPAQVAEIRARYGLDQSLGAQYVTYLRNMATGQWGFSYQLGKPVLAAIRDRLPWTLLLVGSSLLVATLFGIFVGALAAWRRGRGLDTASLTGAIVVDSLPTFWLGMILVAVFAVELRWLPIYGAYTPWGPRSGLPYLLDVLRHLALPATTLTLASLSGTFLVMRYAMLDTLGQDYIRTARSKGLPERQVLVKHAVRNALLPVSTVVFLNLGFLIGGATVIETVFSYPGVGTLLFQAVLNRDYPVLQGAFFILTVSVILANVIADLVYPILDPRVRGSGS
ncbi:MAG: ABC transporter permease [Trueperaceae bacterium]|nr:MAG: ABC transporter permease [Trueperaceae bacterium]